MQYIEIINEEMIKYIKNNMFYIIFPEEANNDLRCYYESIKSHHDIKYIKYIKYYIVKDNNDNIGICGLYSENDDDIWLGWFGVMPEYRRKGYARKILNHMIDESRKMNYKNFRLYTDSVINSNAIKLYESIGLKIDSRYIENIITMSIPLQNNVCKKWNGMPFGF